jgi:hypothetical protein
MPPNRRCRCGCNSSRESAVAQLFSLGDFTRMDIPPILKSPKVPRSGNANKFWRTIVIAGLVLLVVLLVLIWLNFYVFHIFNVANVVSGGN